MSEWTEFNGGECPVAKDIGIEVELRCGIKLGSCFAGDFNWGHGHPDGLYEKTPGDITAYRIINPDLTAPRPSHGQS